MSELKEIYLEPSGCACPKEGQMWCEDTQVCDNCEKPYTRYIRADLAASIGKLEELMANCNDKTNPMALEDDLQKLIDETKK